MDEENRREHLFRGVTQLVLDAKGRLAIPSRHRDALGNGACFNDTFVTITPAD